MARRTERHSDELNRVHRTRAGRVWVAIAPALVFLILLIVFIVENGQHVKVSFFGANTHPPLAIALLVAAVAGAIIVLLAGSVRIMQLRMATRRHARADAAGSPTPAAAHDAKPVEPEEHTDPAGP